MFFLEAQGGRSAFLRRELERSDAVNTAERAVVPIVIYGPSTPLMSPWDESWRH